MGDMERKRYRQSPSHAVPDMHVRKVLYVLAALPAHVSTSTHTPISTCPSPWFMAASSYASTSLTLTLHAQHPH